MTKININNTIKMEEYVERMKLEKADLEQRITKLLAFMESDEFGKLDETEKKLLRMQYAGMDTYLTALDSRLVHEDMKRYQCEIQALNKQIPDLKAQGKTDEEIAKILAEKSMSIPQFSFDFRNMLPILIHGQMLCGANSEPPAAAK